MHAAKAQQSQIAGIEAYLRSGKALTPAEALTNFSCFRLAARVKELKDKKGMAIVTTIKENPVSGNRYASYSLSEGFKRGDRVLVKSIEASIENNLIDRSGFQYFGVGQVGTVTADSDRRGDARVQLDKDPEGSDYFIAAKDLKRA